MAASLDEALSRYLAGREAESLYRRRRTVETPQQPIMRVGGRRVLVFCSNDYLGLANHPALVQALVDGARTWGAGTGAAHLINGHTRAHAALEEELASFTGRSRALLFASGYAANLGVVSALAGRGDRVLQDRLNHASLLDGARLSGARSRRYLHADIDSLRRHLQRPCAGRTLVVSDGVFSMDGDLAPAAALAAACREHGAVLMLDDAHGFGVLGARGAGTCELSALSQNDAPVLMCTLGKALGCAGAFVAGSEALIETLVQRARTYVYSTALPAALAEAARAALTLLESEAWRREYVLALVQRFRAGAQRLGLPLPASMTPIQPLLVGDSARAAALAEALFRAGILVPAIRPPTVPPGRARLRITLSAAHTVGHVDSLLSALEQVWDDSA